MKPKKYLVAFYGRRIGAIGTRYHMTKTVEAFDEEGARFALYEEYEHISILSICEVAS